MTIAIAGYGNAERIAEDRDRDVALLRIYGERGLKPLNLASGNAKSAIEVTGIADPQSQAGGTAASSVRVAIAPSGGSEFALSPAPAVGFSGAAALDGTGKFAGIVLLKPAVVAGPANATPSTQAELVPAEVVREFLKASGVDASGASSDAKAAVVRVICVRKWAVSREKPDCRKDKTP
jgi:hypothetical protein